MAISFFVLILIEQLLLFAFFCSLRLDVGQGAYHCVCDIANGNAHVLSSLSAPPESYTQIEEWEAATHTEGRLV
jgi:hypothetical protein